MRCIACGHEMLGPVCPKCGFLINPGTYKNDDKKKKRITAFLKPSSVKLVEKINRLCLFLMYGKSR